MKQGVSDLASKEALKRQWNVLQVIWTEYLASNKAKEFIVLITKLTKDGENVYTLKNLLNGLEKDGCFNWHQGSKNFGFFDVNNPRFANIYKRTRSAWMFTSGIYECGNLLLNLEESTLQYKDNSPIEISPENNEIKFLTLLMRHPGVTRKYIEIARELETSYFNKNATNEDVAREVQYLRRDLRDILIKAGLSEEIINQMIISKTKIGYKLVSPNTSQNSH